jgi:segregation and condensation protein B
MNESNNDFNEESKEELKEEKTKFTEAPTDEIVKLFENNETNGEFEEFPVEEFSTKESDLDLMENKTGMVPENIEGEGLDVDKLEEQSLEEQMREFHRNLIEASLYAAGRPLTIEELSNRLEFPKKEVEELINEVAFDYLDRSTALVIAQIGDRYQMQIKPEYTEKVSKFAKGGAIAERHLRTLTVIALKQPILKSIVIKIRGTGAYEHVKYLLDNGFINAIKKGRSHELTTTDKYADMFGLPKDKHQLKQAMISQLGIEEGSIDEQSSEREGILTNDQLNEKEEVSSNESIFENLEDLPSETQLEIEEEKEED